MTEYNYQDLINIIAALRAEDGCPWDRVQTHESLRPCMTEEAAELIASIRILKETGNYENMREELGDILLQVVMHSRIAEEEGYFTMEDVIGEISEKMIRRHPHVFGSGGEHGTDAIQKNWEAIKSEEKAHKSWITSPLREVPKELPSLARSVKVLKKADKLFEPLKSDETYLSQISQEALKCSDAESDEELQVRLTNILMSVAGISANHRFYAEQLLDDEVEKFIAKYEQKNGLSG